MSVSIRKFLLVGLFLSSLSWAAPGGMSQSKDNQDGQQSFQNDSDSLDLEYASPAQTTPRIANPANASARSDEYRANETEVGQDEPSYGAAGAGAGSDSLGAQTDSPRNEAGRRRNVSPRPEEPTEFQRHVFGSIGRLLPIYGRDLFQRAPSTFAPVDRIPVSSDYIVGPGDEINLQGWGQLDVDYRAVVDRNGQLFIPKVGNVNVAGVRYSDLKGLLKTVIGRYYKNFDLNVTLGQLRSIPIFVVGHAKKPGSYTVSSLSTLVNALFATGGPATTGSMRSIQLRRGSRTVVEFDLYDLLLRGDKSKDAALMPGDVIYIPPVSRQVAIAGGVNQPAIYEIKAGETLERLIATAGGLTATAAGQKVRVERIDERKALRVDEINLDNGGLARELKAGDIVTVFNITPRFVNAVTLRGYVASPGRSAWKEGMTVRDLIPSREALISSDYWKQRNRVSGSSILFSEDNASPKKIVSEEERSERSQSELQQDVDLKRADINWDYAVIERMNAKDLSTQLIPFNLGDAVLRNDPAANIALQPGDVVTVFSQHDLQVPQARRSMFVRLEGEFNQAGIYQIKPGETLRELITRVGGVTPQSYLYGAMFTRESVRQAQQERLNEFAERFERDIEKQASDAQQTSLGGAEDQARIAADLESKRRLAQKMRRIKAPGRIVLELDPDVKTVDELPNMALEDGDRLFIPAMPSTVSVIGSVYNESAYIYRRGKRAGDYLAQAGGPNKDADDDRIYLMRADGTVLSSEQSGWLNSVESTKLMPGETVIVPIEMDKSSFMRELKDWTQILYQFGLGAAGIAALKGL